MELIKEKINPVVIEINAEFKVKEKMNLDFMRKLISCIDQNIWEFTLTDKDNNFYEILPWDIEDYIDDLKTFKQALKMWCEDINLRILNYSWNISFYSHSDGYDYNIIYHMSQPNILFIDGTAIYKDTYDDIKKILAFDSNDKYIESENY
ncbi:MAG: hypothetical protein IJ880_14970 [Bacilli bacterium]|nr:hypothetical protein [Bacilli bacterium]